MAGRTLDGSGGGPPPAPRPQPAAAGRRPRARKSPVARTTAAAADFLAGGGEMGGRIRAFDWAATPLGAPDAWPQSLKTAVRIMLTSRQPIWIGWGPDLTYLYNDAYKSIIGGKHPHALGRPTSAVWNEIWSDIRPLLDTALTGVEGTYVEEQLLIMERNGYLEETYYTFSYSPVPNDDGGVGGIICANTDDTQRVLDERQLALLRELAAKTVDARSWREACRRSAEALATNPRDVLFAMIYMADPETAAISLAGASGIAPGHAACPENLAGGSLWPVADVVGRSRTTQVQELSEALAADLPTGAWKRPPSQAALLPILPASETGRAGVLIIGLNPFRLLDDNYRGFLELAAGQIAAAVANAQAYEEERRRAEALAELDRAKTAFFSNVSHEFRTPLTLMLGPLEEALAAPAEALAQRRGDLELVHRNSLRLLRLVNTLLDFSRIEAGRTQASYEPVDLAAFTAELASVFRAATDRAGLVLDVDCPPLREPVWVDRDMWEKIVLNLVSNAFKFTFAGGIAVRLRQEGESAVLTVTDTGTGIPEHELPRLFDRFHRAEGARGRTHEGTGIGLALVQELARLHGGAVRADSVLGQGSTFTVTLPLGKAHLPLDRIGTERALASTALGAQPFLEEALRWLPDGASDAPPGVSADLPPEPAILGGERARILLADDNADMRDYLARLLGPHYEVATAPDGAAALAALRAERPDLLLSDVMMPRLDGFGLVRAVRADPTLADLPIVLLSARAGEEAGIEGIEAGADDYLIKPFSARELLARIRANLETARVRRDALSGLRRSEERFRALLKASSYVIYRMSPDWGEMWQLEGREFIADTAEPTAVWLDRYIPAADRPAIRAAIERAVSSKSMFELEHRIRRLDGRLGWTLSRAVPLFDDDGEIVEWIGAASDVTERKQAEALTLCQREALQMLAEDAGLDDVLGFLVRTAEEQAKGLLGSILLLNRAGTHFERGVGPSLPPAFNASVKGIAVESLIGVCCEAVATRRPVVVPDFRADPRWREFADFVAPYDLRAGWSTPIFGSAGKVLGTFANYYREPCDPAPRDIRWVDMVTRTAAIVIERDQANRELRHSRETLTAAMAASDSGTFRWNPHTGEFLDFDENLKRLFGFAPDAPVRQTEDFIARVHPDDVPALRAAIEECRRGSDFSMEYRVVLPDGGIRWLYDRARVECDDDGNLRYLVGACTDVTKRREAEEELRTSEERFRTLAEMIPQLAWMANPDGWIFWYNRGWYEYTGTTPEQMEGWGWQSVHDPEVLPRVLQAWRAALTGGTPFEMVFPIRGADGVFRPFLTRGVPMRDATGAITRWFGTNTDISGQREIQDTLSRLTETLEHELAARTRALEAEMAERQKIEAALHQAQRLEAIGQLTGGVAHDFNNLLTVVLGQAEAIALAADGNERIKRMALAARHAAERGAQLTDQLLSFSGRQRLRPVDMSIDRLLGNMGDLVRRTIGERIAVELAIARDLWPSRVDPAQFESAILNLAINARDAMPEGGRLRMEAHNEVVAGVAGSRLDLRPGDYVVISVRDTGVGMSPDVQRRAFEPFFTTKDIGKGTGLGLSQIYGFARQSGGTATIESAPGRGTTVSLYLPRAASAVAAAAAEPAPPPAAADRRASVLVVEDQNDVREVMAMQLRDLGHRIRTAPDADAALKVLESGEPVDLLLTDVVMPNGVSGIELAEEARRLRPDLPIVIVSGYLRDRPGPTAIPDGVAFLEKPFRQAQLAETIVRALAPAPFSTSPANPASGLTPSRPNPPG